MKNNENDAFLGSFFAGFIIALIPIYTFWFGTLQNPFDYTLSMIGNRFDRMNEFIIWGTVSGLLLFLYIINLFREAAFQDKRARRMLVYSTIFLVLTVITPAVEEINRVTHRLHAVFGALFGIFLSTSLYFFIRYLRTVDEDVFGRSMIYLNIVILGSLSLFIVFGNNGIFELFFFLTLSFFLWILKRWIYQL
ncbi:MAG: hypothetical protein M0Q90_07910 [Bacteroidales bacterium]|nr:hypothetical protein [Bacteroidales bacterium]